MRLGPLNISWGRAPAAAAPAVAPAAPAGRPLTTAHGLGGTRLRVSSDNPQLGPLSGLTLLGPVDNEGRWRDLSLDARTLDRLAPADLLELLCDLSPDISRALWDFLRLSNPGWECRALNAAGETDARAQAAVDAFLDHLGDLYGSVDVVLGRLFFAAFLRGGFAAELVLDQRARMPVDLVMPDPRWIYFRRVADAVRGPVWEPFQWQGGQQVSLAIPTFRYVPVDPFPGSPYGRSLASPALFGAVFALALLHDLRRVVQQQGYPRLDISISLEQLLLAMPAELKNDPMQAPQALQTWVDQVIAEVKRAYSALEPDDTYIHTDVVTLNKPVGTVDTSSLGAVDGLITALERMSVRALKTMPLMMGMADGVSEANANRQWEIHAAGLKALQHLCEQMLEYLLTLALQVQGIPAEIEFRFAEVRAAELLRDAQVEQLNTATAWQQFQYGWLSMDAAAMKGAGVEKADKQEPRIALNPTTAKPGSAAQDPAAVQAEPGGNRVLVANGKGRE